VADPVRANGVSAGITYEGPAFTVGGELPVAVVAAQKLPDPSVE